ncbi:exosortase/archaeosortase family protein [Marinobacter manganoxydans]|nr:exosortase/archaeosortase family protein [Marinobacter manganoxydans]
MLRKTFDNLPNSLPFLVVSAVAVVLFYPTWFRLGTIWLEFEQVLAHGLATAVIFLGMLMIHPPRPAGGTSGLLLKPYHLLGGIALIGVTLVWLLLELVRIDTLAYLMLPAGVMAVSWTLLGLKKALSFLPYVALLSLSLPFWADLVPPLVSLASVVVGSWVRLFGMTALIEGNSITLPYGRLLIADGCSGIRYFAISILLAMMTSILNDYRWKGWLITVVVAMLIGLVANWVRITILVFVAYETNMQSDLLTDHETMGWIVFGAFILPALYFSPVRKRSKANQQPTAIKLNIAKAGIPALIIAVLLGPVALTLAQTSAGQQAPWALELDGFQARGESAELPLPITLPSLLDQKILKAGNTAVSLAQSQKTTADDKLVPYLPPIFDNSTWQIEERMGPGISLYLNILTRDRVLMAQWYQVGSRSSLNYRKAKLLQIPATLTGENRFALVTIQVPCRDRDCGDELSRLERIKTMVETQL